MYARFANSDRFPVTIRSPMLERVYIREGGYVGARLPDQDEAMFLGEGYVDDDGLVVAWLSSDSIPRNMHRAGLSKPAWGQREIEEWAARHGATLHWQEMGVDSLTVRGASKQAADELAWSNGAPNPQRNPATSSASSRPNPRARVEASKYARKQRGSSK